MERCVGGSKKRMERVYAGVKSWDRDVQSELNTARWIAIQCTRESKILTPAYIFIYDVCLHPRI